MKKTTVLSCPFCKEELEVVGKGHYFAHKINGCILQHLCFEIDDDEAVKLWNTRKPLERIVERLEVEHKKSEYCPKFEKVFRQVAFEEAIAIVKEEGGLNGN